MSRKRFQAQIDVIIGNQTYYQLLFHHTTNTPFHKYFKGIDFIVQACSVIHERDYFIYHNIIIATQTKSYEKNKMYNTYGLR